MKLVRRLYEAGGPFSLPLSPDEAALDRLFRDLYEEQFES